MSARIKITNPFYRPDWHQHAFSPLCTDEVHGRFDAIEDTRGIWVLNVGTMKIVASASSRKEAIEIAEALAAEWRPALPPRARPG